MIITIDGPSGTGKSTIAKRLATLLGYSYFDTGAMYRSITWMLLKQNCDIEDAKALKKALSHFDFRIEEGDAKRYFVNEQEVTKEIRSIEVTNYVSEVAAKKEVREKLVHIQRHFAEKKDAVFEGRDMGTVVFPDAPLKIFLTAKASVRARRRFLELQEKFPENKGELDESKILEDIEKRDAFDSSRELSPLKKTDDMVEVDTSNRTIDEVLSEILKAYYALPKQKRFLYWAVLFAAWLFLKVFYRLKIERPSSVPNGPAIIAPNHVSYLDPPVAAVSSPEEIHFLARASLFKIPLLGRLIRKLNSHPVKEGAKDAVVLKEILKLLHKGNKVLLFPEGKRAYDNTLGEIQPGIAFLVMRAKCPVIPVYIQGTFDIWNRKKKFPKLWGKIRCIVGEPLFFDDLDVKDRKAFIEEVGKRVKNSLENLSKKAV